MVRKALGVVRRALIPQYSTLRASRSTLRAANLDEKTSMSEERTSTDGRIERAKEAALGPHTGEPSLGDEIGEATGGIAGVLLGAGIGSSAGPIGTLIGGIAGAIGGWWTGRAIAEAAEKLTEEDDTQFRAHYESTERPADQRYEDVRGAYFLGHIASSNPNFTDREFAEVEPELARGWQDCGNPPCTWAAARAYVGEGYRRGTAARQRTDARTMRRVADVEQELEQHRAEGYGEVL